MNKNVIYWILITILLLAALAVSLNIFSPQEKEKSYRVAVPPFVDTAIIAYGGEKDTFKKYGLNVELINVAWEGQYDLIAGGGLDISMSTLSEFANKDANLRRANRRVRYLFPAWQFLGLGFYTNDNYRTLNSFEEEYSSEKALDLFANQLKGKKVVVPEGSVFETALLQFLESVNVPASEVELINASLDSALNSLSDNQVVLVAVGSQQRFEAERRGYSEAIAPNKLGADILTGFVSSDIVFKENPEALQRFTCAWYDMLNEVELTDDKGYSVISEYLEGTGAGLLSLEEYIALRQYNSFATNIEDARKRFLAPDGDAYWKRVWTRSLASMTAGDQALPPDDSGFVAADLLSLPTETCLNFLVE